MIQDPLSNLIQNVAYSHFTYQSTREALGMNIWVPDSPGTYAAMLLVHGGDFTSGCRDSDSDVAAEIATPTSGDVTTPYIVATIDYRLAYQHTDSDRTCYTGPGASTNPYCGWCYWEVAGSSYCNAGNGLLPCPYQELYCPGRSSKTPRLPSPGSRRACRRR